MATKAQQLRERRAKIKERGVAAQVIMAIDIDGRRGIVSQDGTNSAWAATFDGAWRQYLNREYKLMAAREVATPYEETESVTV